MNLVDGPSDEIYKLNKKYIFSLTLVALISTIVGFSSNFSISQKVTSTVESALKSNRKCPMSYSKLDIATLLPTVSITDLNISSRCIGSKESLIFSKVKSSLSLPSFAPLGLTLSSELNDKFSKVNIDSIHGLNGHYVKLHSNKLNAKTLTPLLNGLNLTGHFKVNSNAQLSTKALKDLDISLSSKNFTVPAQNMMGFDLPTMKIGQVGLKAKLSKSNVLDISNFVLGQELSPIRAKVTGEVKLDKYRVTNSNIDLKVIVKFSKSFLESFSILNLFLDSSKRDDQGFYNLRFKGKLGSPGKPIYEN